MSLARCTWPAKTSAPTDSALIQLRARLEAIGAHLEPTEGGADGRFTVAARDLPVLYVKVGSEGVSEIAWSAAGEFCAGLFECRRLVINGAKDLPVRQAMYASKAAELVVSEKREFFVTKLYFFRHPVFGELASVRTNLSMITGAYFSPQRQDLYAFYGGLIAAMGGLVPPAMTWLRGSIFS